LPRNEGLLGQTPSSDYSWWFVAKSPERVFLAKRISQATIKHTHSVLRFTNNVSRARTAYPRLQQKCPMDNQGK
jgi:hypothetical protein